MGLKITFFQRAGQLLACLCFLLLTTASWAQGPTSLQYPANIALIANESNLYLAPTLSGTVTSYSISPALPAGLSLNTNTGVISGTPIAPTSGPQTYTITAKGAGGSSTTKQVSINVTGYAPFNNNSNGLAFLGSRRTFYRGTALGGNGQTAGDIAVYSNVVTISGQQIDCIVKTVTVSNVNANWQAYDQPLATDGSTYSNNNDSFFSPQVTFTNTTNPKYIIFSFQFIIGGTYNASTQSGTNVIL